MSKIKNPFTEHPKSVNESYMKHFLIAFGYFFIFLKLSLISLIHAVFPFMFKKTVSTEIVNIADDMKKRNKKSE